MSDTSIRCTEMKVCLQTELANTNTNELTTDESAWTYPYSRPVSTFVSICCCVANKQRAAFETNCIFCPHFCTLYYCWYWLPYRQLLFTVMLANTADVGGALLTAAGARVWRLVAPRFVFITAGNDAVDDNSCPFNYYSSQLIFFSLLVRRQIMFPNWCVGREQLHHQLAGIIPLISQETLY